MSPDISGKFLFSSAPFGFYSMDRRGAISTLIPSSNLNRERTFSVTQDYDGKLWVTTLKGLKLWENEEYVTPKLEHPELYQQARDVKILPDSSMVFLLRGNGILVHQRNGTTTHLTEEQGLTTNNITSLYIGQDGKIYACSNEGLNILSSDTKSDWEIKTLTIKNGLPSNQINDIEILNNQLWIATNRGLVHMKSPVKSAPIPSPVLESFMVNNNKYGYTHGMRLKHDQNNIAIRFFALHFRSGGDILYRYRISGPDTTFIMTREREIHFAALTPLEYAIEVQAQNEEGTWSKPAFWSFEIIPAWWQTIWFRILLVIFLLGGVWIYFENRLKAARLETAHKDQIRNLQAAALRAQMNPHFIFNSLSSIKQFIVQNDQQSASRYLARFARLIRLALYGSVEGKHTLRQEVEMLENYLLLEQLRFRNKFSFTIKMDEEIKPDEILIPPMFIQPIVENSILHGLKNKSSDVYIEIRFSMEGTDLRVSISDNGTGFTTIDKPVDSSSHKSVGTNVTQQRLALLSGNTKKESYIMENKVNENGEVTGSEVKILIATQYKD